MHQVGGSNRATVSVLGRGRQPVAARDRTDNPASVPTVRQRQMEILTMMRNATMMTMALAALALTAGCNDGSVDPISGEGPLAAAELAEVALQSDLVTEAVLSAELATMSAATTEESGGRSGVVTQDITFSRTRSCPGGGQFHLEGEIHRTFDRDTRVMEAESSGLRSRTDCTFRRGQYTVTVNGIAEWDAFRRRVEGAPDGLQTTHYFGSKSAVRSDGQERSCEFDITIVRDPETHTRTLDGMICGTEVHRSVTWSFGE
jgi:hypothetical protein